MNSLDLPIGLLAELTHRCPLKCSYCSNPVELIRRGRELDTATWRRVFEEASELGVLHVHLSGGEPTVRPDLEVLIECAVEAGIYTNLITSGVLLDHERVASLYEAGLDHVQLSVQGSEPDLADWLGGMEGGHLKKLAVARLIGDAGLALTVNAVVHRHNLHQLGDLIELALAMGAMRLEVAHAQYVGWALHNRASLMPTRRQLDEATALVEASQRRLDGVLVIDYVVPDYHGMRPKACMGGWGQELLVVTPDGKVLPCHAAQCIRELEFESVLERSLSAIWHHSPAFARFRGTDWMPEPCRSCPRRDIDWGGCRCQAYALTGDAARPDPVCEYSPDHHLVRRHARAAEIDDDTRLVARGDKEMF